MFVVIAKKIQEGVARGFQRQNNVVVRNAVDEVALQVLLNDLVNEGDRGERHEIIQVLWKGTSNGME
jgi:hypothetical protein